MRNRTVKINDAGKLEITDDIPDTLQPFDMLFMNGDRLGMVTEAMNDKGEVTVALKRREGKLSSEVRFIFAGGEFRMPVELPIP